MRKKSAIEQNITPRIKCIAPWRLIKVEPLPHYKLNVEFGDGTQGVVDMLALIGSSKAGVFAALKNVAFFNQVHLEYGVATWPGEIDLSPDAMYEEIKKSGCWSPG